MIRSEPPTSRPPAPAPAELHLWLADPADLPEPAPNDLAPDERAREERFVRPHVARDFRRARFWLRKTLGAYLGCEPREVKFEYGFHGKPEAAGPAPFPIRFNLSHTGGRVLLGVSNGRILGVDVESHRTQLDRSGMARRYFSAAEVAEFETFPHDEQIAAFFRGWTRKEAYLKARGSGLALPLDRFTVPLGAAAPERILEVADEPGEAARWRLLDVPAGPLHAAAVVIEEPTAALRYFADGELIP
ncbi:MAG TPA: 4'-phosphopantetheinyl transferase superfamily protein [Planctomycetia bacterium]|nr:4'-phosphopantetheinyl transferase superfamily protein [Planctomycetia bacterium]